MTETKTILAIDDDPDILYTLREILAYQNWKACTATNWREAQLQLSANSVDLVLVDYHMPELDGIAVVAKLRKILPQTPIIVLTVEERGAIMDKFIKAGANDYAIKPIKAVDLISRLTVHLQYNERSRYYANQEKGISQATLRLIEDVLKHADGYMTVDDIGTKTGLKSKTVYRYMHYMVSGKSVAIRQIYQKSGRPKIEYKLRV